MKKNAISLIAALFCTQAHAAPPPAVVAVLSKADGVYMEAFSAFQAAYGADIPHYDLSRSAPDLPPQVRTVVAFGGKAAALNYPPRVDLVYAMAPGLVLSRRGTARSVKISLIPGIHRVLARIKDIQPDIRKLTVFWSADRYDSLAQEAFRIASHLGIEITLQKVGKPEDLPGLLRGHMGRMEAFWLPPDPLLVTPVNLRILREFSWSNGVPFYGTTKGMSREGAVASVGVTYRDMGEAAAVAVRGLERGGEMPEVIYPEKEELTLNATAARRCRLDLSGRLTGEAAFLFP